MRLNYIELMKIKEKLRRLMCKGRLFGSRRVENEDFFQKKTPCGIARLLQCIKVFHNTFNQVLSITFMRYGKNNLPL